MARRRIRLDAAVRYRLQLERLEQRIVPGETLFGVLTAFGALEPTRQFIDGITDRSAGHMVRSRPPGGARQKVDIPLDAVADFKISTSRFQPTEADANDDIASSTRAGDSVDRPAFVNLLAPPPGLAVDAPNTTKGRAPRPTICTDGCAPNCVGQTPGEAREGSAAIRLLTSQSNAFDGVDAASPPQSHVPPPGRRFDENVAIEDSSNARDFSSDASRSTWSGFVAGNSYPTGSSPRSTAIGDLNGDANLDLVSANYDSNSVSVMLGNGDGTFGPFTDFAAGMRPNSVALADFNADGNFDVVVPQVDYMGHVGVLMGNGDGTLQAPVSYPVELSSVFAEVGDFNGDGLPDIVCSNGSSKSVSVLLNDGNGAFLPQVPYSLSAQPYYIRVHDLNGDGALDLAIASNGVTIMLGNGDGTFQTKGSFPSGGGDLAVGDFDGDAIPDIAQVKGSFPVAMIGILLGNGDGSFQLPSEYPVGHKPSGVVAGDVDGDGDLDLAMSINDDNNVIVLRNQLGRFRRRQIYVVGDSPTSISISDLNGDGALDLVTPDRVSNSLSILLGYGTSAFQAASWAFDLEDIASVTTTDLDSDNHSDLVVSLEESSDVRFYYGKGNGTFDLGSTQPAGHTLTDMVQGDFNGDGVKDMAFADSKYSAANVLLGGGGQEFMEVPQIPVGSGMRSMLTTDLNLDGKPDLAILRQTDEIRFLSILLGNGDGAFQPPVDYDIDFSTEYMSLYTDDLNQDTVPDLVFLEGGNVVKGRFFVLLGQGDGSFEAPIASPLVYWHNNDMTFADFDEDGSKDAIVGYLSGTSLETVKLWLLRGNGDGSFGAPLEFYDKNNDGGPTRLATADFNGDSHQDLLTSLGYSVDDAIIHLGNGDGTFQPAAHYDTEGPNSTGPLIDDFDMDGNLDFLVAQNYVGTLGVLRLARGNGDGTFQPPVAVGVDAHSFASIKVIDFDDDGILDIVSTGYYHGSSKVDSVVALFRGQGDGTFELIHRYFAGSEPGRATVADFNGDHKPDVVVTNTPSETIGLLFNVGNGFDAPTSYSTETTYPASGPTSLVAGDFNGDGLDDLAKTNVTGTLSVLLALENGKMADPVNYPAGAAFLDIVSLDLDGDGILDLAASSSGDGTVTVLIGVGDGTFLPGATIVVGGTPVSIASGFFDSGSIPDLVLANANGTVNILLGASGGAFLPPISFDAGPNPLNAKVGDFDQDGIADLAVVNGTTLGTVSVLLGRGDGTFKPRLSFGVGVNPDAFVIGLFNGDSFLDLAVAENYGVTTVFNGGS